MGMFDTILCKVSLPMPDDPKGYSGSSSFQTKDFDCALDNYIIDENNNLLIVQTDAFIFDTDYTEFLEYSYVGAPWHSHLINRNLTGLYCGNGGYSLRNIHDCLRILQDDVKVFSFNEILPFCFSPL